MEVYTIRLSYILPGNVPAPAEMTHPTHPATCLTYADSFQFSHCMPEKEDQDNIRAMFLLREREKK